MKMILKGRDRQHGEFTSEISVTELQYDFRTGWFGHPYVFSDLYTYVPCESNLAPQELILRWDGTVVITFATSEDWQRSSTGLETSLPGRMRAFIHSEDKVDEDTSLRAYPKEFVIFRNHSSRRAYRGGGDGKIDVRASA